MDSSRKSRVINTIRVAAVVLVAAFLSPIQAVAVTGDTNWTSKSKYGIFLHYQYRILLGYSIKTKPSSRINRKLLRRGGNSSWTGSMSRALPSRWPRQRSAGSSFASAITTSHGLVLPIRHFVAWQDLLWQRLPRPGRRHSVQQSGVDLADQRVPQPGRRLLLDWPFDPKIGLLKSCQIEASGPSPAKNAVIEGGLTVEAPPLSVDKPPCKHAYTIKATQIEETSTMMNARSYR